MLKKIMRLLFCTEIQSLSFLGGRGICMQIHIYFSFKNKNLAILSLKFGKKYKCSVMMKNAHLILRNISKCCFILIRFWKQKLGGL